MFNNDKPTIGVREWGSVRVPKELSAPVPSDLDFTPNERDPYHTPENVYIRPQFESYIRNDFKDYLLKFFEQHG